MGSKELILPNNFYLEEQFRPMERILRCKFCGLQKSKNDWLNITRQSNQSYPDPELSGQHKLLYYVWCPECEDHRHLVYDFYER